MWVWVSVWTIRVWTIGVWTIGVYVRTDSDPTQLAIRLRPCICLKGASRMSLRLMRGV